ncbi:hypothetical protein [Azohydromonas australica]|nr:hypothetical protein [Azohydromonas australica]
MSQVPHSPALDFNGLAQAIARTHHELAAQATPHFQSKGQPPC